MHVAVGDHGPAEDKAAEELIRRAVDLGVDHFDSSDMYAGAITSSCSAALKGRRDKVVVATKFGQPEPGGR
jgi:aryl-alcohol dehydrogenase-like predicted oxidoreductase